MADIASHPLAPLLAVAAICLAACSNDQSIENCPAIAADHPRGINDSMETWLRNHAETCADFVADLDRRCSTIDDPAATIQCVQETVPDAQCPEDAVRAFREALLPMQRFAHCHATLQPCHDLANNYPDGTLRPLTDWARRNPGVCPGLGQTLIDCSDLQGRHMFDCIRRGADIACPQAAKSAFLEAFQPFELSMPCIGLGEDYARAFLDRTELSPERKAEILSSCLVSYPLDPAMVLRCAYVETP